MDDLTALEDWLAPLLAKLQPSERRKLTRDIARDLRRSQAQRIAAQRNPDGSGYVPRKAQLRDRMGGIRRKMFVKIAQTKHLKVQSTAAAASVGFASRASRIARIHQFGLTDRVRPDGPEEKYAQRRLLGYQPLDLDSLRASILRHLTS